MAANLTKSFFLRALVAAGPLLGCSSRTPPAAQTTIVEQQASTKSRPNRTPAITAWPEPPPAFAELTERVHNAERDTLLPGRAQLPDMLLGLNNEAIRQIQFRPERALWHGESGHFEVQGLHPGGSYLDLVELSVLPGTAHPFPFSPQLFNYGSIERPDTGAGLGFAGFRVHAPLNQPDHHDEFLVFHGASYFRSLARGQAYGLSARGLAVDMGQDTPEEFPVFSQFYLVEPAPEDEALWLLATLVSGRTRGAYAFHVTPGASTTVHVFARIWVDGPVKSLGLAPLSSMFLFGEESPAAFGDYRPEVHDSDSMVFVSHSGERLVRPLRNPPRTTRSEFRLDSPAGFGLLQRDRNFDHYQDLALHYQDRPSVWIEPRGDWGPGALHLLEITTLLESDDNVALAWVPDQVPDEGLDLQYKITFGEQLPRAAPGAQVSATRMERIDDGTRFIVDFHGPELQTQNTNPPTAQVDATHGTLVGEPTLHPLPDGGVRLVFDVTPASMSDDVELRAYLYDDQDTLSETWSYRWRPGP